MAYLVLCVFYLATAPEVRIEAEDAYWYANDVETLPLRLLFHPYHLIYLPVMKGILVFVHALGGPERAYPVLAFTSVLLASGVVLLTVQLLHDRLGSGWRPAIIGGGLVAFSYGFWRYAHEVEVYGLGILLALLFLQVGLRDPTTMRSVVAAGLLGVLAVLGHVLNVILALTAVPLFLALKRRVGALVVYLGVFMGTLAVTGFVTHRLVASPETGLVEYYEGQMSGETSFHLLDLVRSTVSFGQDVASGNFLFTYATFRGRIDRLFPLQMLEDDKFLGESAPAAVRFLSPVTLLLLLVSFTLVVARMPVGVRSALRQPATLAIAAWLGAHSLGMLWIHRAGQPEVWLLVLPAFWVLVVRLGLSDDGPGSIRLGGLLVAALVAHNAIAGMAMLQDPEADRNRRKAAWLLDNVDPEDVVVTAESSVFARFLRYHVPGEVVDLEFLDRKTMEQVFDRLRSIDGDVYVTGDVVDPPARNVRLIPESTADLKAYVERHRSDFRLLHDDPWGGIYRFANGSGDGDDLFTSDRSSSP